MTLWAFETNLMWSSKLRQSLRLLGHECLVLKAVPEEGTADAAIVNLGEPGASELLAALGARGVPTIAHAGHKEKDLHDLGRAAGATILATNSEMANKLPALLEKVRTFGDS